MAEWANELDPNLWWESELAAENLVEALLIRERFPQDRIEAVGHLKVGFGIQAHGMI